MLAKSKLSSIETLTSQALIDMEISHEEFVTILKEKDKYEKMNENLRIENENQKIMRLSSIKSKTLFKIKKNFKRLKLNEKQPKLLRILCHCKILFFSCVCIKWTHLHYSLQTHGKKMLKLQNMVVKYG